MLGSSRTSAIVRSKRAPWGAGGGDRMTWLLRALPTLLAVAGALAAGVAIGMLLCRAARQNASDGAELSELGQRLRGAQISGVGASVRSLC